MSHTSLRVWSWLHKWSSLICTVFMLLLCLTGLPLIFGDEIDALSERAVPAGAPTDSASADLAVIEQAARQAKPGLVPLYFFADKEHPDLWYVKLDSRVDSDESQASLLAIDARSATILPAPILERGFMQIVYRLHVDLFAALPGKLFLGLMGALLILSLISGTVLYAPFMRRLDFGTIRTRRHRRVRWLDRHNLLGIATLLWLVAVGGSGVINSLAEQFLKTWQDEQTARVHAGQVQRILPPLAGGESGLILAANRALSAYPEMQISAIAFPGTLLSTPRHFAVILHGKTPLTSRLRQTALVDPVNGEVLQAGRRPWYITLFQLSQPLHFGDYGGLPLKLIWAVLDLISIITMGSGIYLWWSRHHASTNESDRRRVS